MGIFKRIKTITGANSNRLLDSMEDPIAMLDEYMREMEQELGKTNSALAKQIFVENKQTDLISQTKVLAENKASQAKLAIEKGDEATAKLAVKEKINLEQQVSLYEQQLETIKEQTIVLKDKFNELEVTYNELQHKKILLVSRANVAKSIKQIHKVSTSNNCDNIVRGVTRAEEKILFWEAEVQAGNQTSNPMNNNGISFANVSEEEVSNELSKLKK